MLQICRGNRTNEEKMAGRFKRYLRKFGKILLWIAGSVIGLFLLLVLLLQIPPIQNFAKDKAVAYLEGKIKTKVEIGRIEIGLPKKVIIEDFYFESRQKDTLLAGQKLAVDISLFKLFSDQVEINSVALTGVTANISRGKDSIFNFDYIIDAFASKEPKDDSDPMTISVKRVTLDDIRFKFDDKLTKNDVALRLTHFDTRFDRFNLDEMDFDIPEINLDGLKLTLDQGLVEKAAETSVKVVDTLSKRPDLKLDLGAINLSRIDLGYASEGSLNTGVRIGKLKIDVDEIDLPRQQIKLNSFELKTIRGSLAIGNQDKDLVIPHTDTTAIKQTGWNLKLRKTSIADVNFKFDDNGAKPTAKGIDFKHLDMTGFSMESSDLAYSDAGISGKIKSLALSEKSGLEINALRTDFSYDPRGASLKNLYLETPHTRVRDNISVQYASVESIKTNPENLYLDAELKKSRIAFRDILTIVPSLESTSPFADNPNAVVLIDTRISGRISDLRILRFSISGIGQTTVAMSGTIKGLPDAKTAYFDVDIANLKTSAKDIIGLIPPGTIPADIRLPDAIALKGKIKGSQENFATALNIASTFGNAWIKAQLDRRVKNRETYDADIRLENFEVGRLIGNDSLGKVTLSSTIKGKGFDPNTANAKITGFLQSAEFNRYLYRDLKIDASVSGGQYVVDAGMNDPNLTFKLDAGGGFSGKYPTGKLKLNLDIADLNKLNLHAGPMKIRGELDADVSDSDPDNLNGRLDLHHIQILKDADPIVLDSINVVAVSTADSSSISLKSQFARARMSGKYKLTQLGDAITNTISKYYDIKKGPAVKTDPQSVDFEIRIRDDKMLEKIAPQITGLEPIDIKGGFNSVNDSIALIASIPRLVYGANRISGANVKVDTKDGALVYDISIDGIENQQLSLPFTDLSGTIKDNVVTYNLLIRDRGKKDQYAIAGTVKSVGDDTEINLNPEGLMLNYEAWTISPNNVIRVGKNGLYANNFELRHGQNSLRLQSQSGQPNAPLDVTPTDFSLATLLNMVRKDELLADGTMNGTATLRDLTGTVNFTSDLTISQFKFRGNPVGDISLKVDNQTAGTLAAQMNLTGNGNQLDLRGTYGLSAQSLALKLDIDKLNIESLQGFTFDNIKEGKGYLSGNLDIGGTIDMPRVMGQLKFNDVALRVTQLNSYFKDINETVFINADGLTFDKFTVYDQKDNRLIVNGKLLTNDFRDYRFDLTINAENFRAINSKAKDNDQYYGDLYMDADLDVSGSLESPKVGGNVRINEDTKFTVVLPQSDPSIADREGIVEFVDEDNKMLQETAVLKNAMDQSELKGMDVSVNIEIVKEALLSLVIDKGNGDFLDLQGEAQLTGGIDPSGKTTLTGKYQFTEGAYEMTFNLIKRRFEIKPGSFLIWNGEPTAANVNLTAIYKVDAPPIDLVGDQLGNVEQTIRNTYKQRLPFEAHLKMEGQLLRPKISFDIILPEGNYAVSSEIVNATEAKLAQLRQEPDELNKQVFALLLLNRFVGENPFSSEAGGTTAESMARQSVSKILSQQMNNIAGDLIKGFELNFDLESTEDYTTGVRENRTDLNLGVSKKLLNDRLKVSVGSTFGLEGPQQQNEQANNIAGDISADYQLTRDGRYMVRAYRKNEYQMALQGQVVETGVAFIITMDYNKFRELFHRSEEEKEMIRKERARKKMLKEKAKEQEEKAKEEEKAKDADEPESDTTD